MKTCPVCEGKGVVGKLGGPAEPVVLFGKVIPSVTLEDQPCRNCRGSGEVPEPVFTHCNVCGIKLRTRDEDGMGMCERCAGE